MQLGIHPYKATLVYCGRAHACKCGAAIDPACAEPDSTSSHGVPGTLCSCAPPAQVCAYAELRQLDALLATLIASLAAPQNEPPAEPAAAPSPAAKTAPVTPPWLAGAAGAAVVTQPTVLSALSTALHKLPPGTQMQHKHACQFGCANNVSLTQPLGLNAPLPKLPLKWVMHFVHVHVHAHSCLCG